MQGANSFLQSSLGIDKSKRAIIDEEIRINDLRDLLEREGSESENGKLLYTYKVAFSARLKQPPPPPPSTSTSAKYVPPVASNPLTAALDSNEAELDDLNANVIYFKDNRPYDHPSFEGTTFANQKVPLGLLLKQVKKKNPLMWECEPGMVRYFHLPANNMVRHSSLLKQRDDIVHMILTCAWIVLGRGEPISHVRDISSKSY